MILLIVIVLFGFASLYTLLKHIQIRMYLKREGIRDADFKSLPFLGHGLVFPVDGNKFGKAMQQIVNNHLKKWPEEDCFCLWLSPIHANICYYKAGASKRILLHKDFQNKGFIYFPLIDWIKRGLLTSRDAKWKNRRRMITPSFHYEILKNFSSIFNRNAKILSKKIQLSIQRSGKDEVELDFFELVCLMALDNISEAAMGKSVWAQCRSNNKYVTAVKQVSSTAINRMKRWYWYSWYSFMLFREGRETKRNIKFMHKYTLDIIKDRIKNYKDLECCHEPNRQAFLDLLINNYIAGDITLDGIHEEVDTFMFEGHDTTASALGFFVWNLANCKESQKRLQEEIDEKFQIDRSDFDFENLNVEYNDVENLNFLNLCSTETLRIFPTVPFLGRCRKNWNENLVQFSSLPLFIGRSEEYWKDPMEFRPERHLMEADPFTSIAFSVGSRNCVGQRFAKMEIAYTISHLFSTFDVSTSQSLEELKVSPDVILRPLGGIKIKFKLRT